ncbi:RNA polymerase sigma factor SigZ [Vibrio ezurae]|uniref:RNA polymerase sigma factor SigZ n=1 Tax=Vibrio ezurae NBRC 102218 TaxID=1219080 RepID=U3B765_9VIBR|nr:RNA polymerase sigma factor SigZ [Vibrio ezurae]GAD81262.1 putative RNA polymerase ECF-type sigma factor [Vibrio ezurae NBRC 102218]
MNIETIWAQYQTSLKAFLHKNINNPDDVDDLLQEILIKTYRSLNTVKDVTKIKPWLFQIAQRSIIDFYRVQNKNLPPENEELWHEQPNQHLYDQLAECVLPFINALDEDDKQLLNAIEIEGVSQKDYAEQHGIKYSTLKSRVKKSRNTLHAAFKQCCDFEMDTKGNLMDYHKKYKECKPQ